jgi:hypothetical protein
MGMEVAFNPIVLVSNRRPTGEPQFVACQNRRGHDEQR